MNVRDIVAIWLKDNGYDGLYSLYGECSCVVDDLMPCESPFEECKPGYVKPCPGSEMCRSRVGGGCAFHIGEKTEHV